MHLGQTFNLNLAQQRIITSDKLVDSCPQQDIIPVISVFPKHKTTRLYDHGLILYDFSGTWNLCAQHTVLIDK